MSDDQDFKTHEEMKEYVNAGCAPPKTCFSCGKEITLKDYKKFHKNMRKGILHQQILDDMGFIRICCRRMFLGDNSELRRKAEMYDYSAISDNPVL